MNQKTIKGKILIDNKWFKKEVPVPLFIDVSVYSFKYKKQIKFLREHSHFTTGRLASKEGANEKIKEDGEFAHLIIPTMSHTDFKNFSKFLKEHQQIVMKPRRGQRGEGIFMLAKNRNKYILSYDKKEEVLSKKDLKKFYEETLSERPYIYQKYIHSKTKFGDPFDCRIRLEKNGKGKWEVVINLIRIGSGQKVVSNVAQGGSVSELDPFLKANYGDKWESIKDSIIEVGRTFPYKLEKLFNQELGSLGIDIGIDQEGKLYLFESNNAPGTEFGEGAIALVKCDYYKYMLDKLSK
ncbi:YheC/YheD family protein [Virgibacillus sp. NKC19-16]|uniref:YheC/YheD family protein n=1 Tax=Virgibacillus salidurans TaxID=2831673 RepID=UPI001F3A37B9|nr:YheC/YheD family protein [Virgibacillus sp. NKC19-16]UJL45903.1 YheC/YheD family protein [Virgibacillus sp. NKC19-16]